MPSRTKAARSHLSDYYARLKLNPVRHDISSPERMRAHESKRRNLLENRLKLPFLLWDGAKVLEFGPASGENAVVLARHGARLTFVEPLDYLIAELRENFSRYGVADRIEAVHADVVETFRSSRKYDVVFAEGFIQCLDEPYAAISKLSGFLADGGFLIVSAPNTCGTFIEFLKKVYLELIFNSLGIVDSEHRLKAARRLFAAQFARINHSRSFDSWAKDNLLSPLYRLKNFLELPEMLAALPADVHLYSSWPNYLYCDDMTWHKTVKGAAAARQDCLDGYNARVPHFLHGLPLPQGELELFNPREGEELAGAIRGCMAKLDRAIEEKAADAALVVGALKALRCRIKLSAKAVSGLQTVEAWLALFESAATADSQAKYERAWNASAVLESWGIPGHYCVFQRTDLHGAPLRHAAP